MQSTVLYATCSARILCLMIARVPCTVALDVLLPVQTSGGPREKERERGCVPTLCCSRGWGARPAAGQDERHAAKRHGLPSYLLRGRQVRDLGLRQRGGDQELPEAPPRRVLLAEGRGPPAPPSSCSHPPPTARTRLMCAGRSPAGVFCRLLCAQRTRIATSVCGAARSLFCPCSVPRPVRLQAIALKGSACDNGHPGCLSGIVNRSKA